MSMGNQEQNGAVVLYKHHTARNRALVDRMAFSADADIRASEKSQRDELEAKMLAEKAADAKRTMGKYAACRHGFDCRHSFLEVRGMSMGNQEQNGAVVLYKHHTARNRALVDRMAFSADAEKVVSDDTTALRDKIACEYGDRNARDRDREENRRFASGLTPEQD